MDSVSAFAQGVGQKAKGNYDVLALNNQVSTLERELANTYRQLGEAYYNLHNTDPDSQLATYVEQIVEKQNRISELKATIDDTKAATAAVQLVPPQEMQQTTPIVTNQPVRAQYSGRVCIKCGQPIGDEMFCGRCGAKQEEQVASEEPVRCCIKCGKPIGDELFCGFCGAKQDEESTTDAQSGLSAYDPGEPIMEVPTIDNSADDEEVAE